MFFQCVVHKQNNRILYIHEYNFLISINIYLEKEGAVGAIY
jgi:hypothetical protein